MNMRKMMMVCMVAVVVLSTVTVTQAGVIQKDIETREMNNDKTERVNAIVMLLNNPEDKYRGLHELAMMVYEIIAILIGHNMISMSLTRLLVGWFILPTVVVGELLDVNATFPFKYYWNMYSQEFRHYIENAFFYWGILGALVVVPIIYILIFCGAFVVALRHGGVSGESLMERILSALDYIYTPDYWAE